MHSETAIVFQELDAETVDLIGSIDRSEEIHEQYRLKDGELELVPFRVSVKGFDSTELAELIDRQQKILAENGYVIGAFADEKLIGVASVENRKRGSHCNYMKMDILYVSHPHRAKGIGAALLSRCKKKAQQLGAEKLYISATPTRSTVDFYLRNGTTLVTEVDADLFRLEPEDIHLELRVS